MRYELWHIESANLMDDFGTESEAVAAARAYLTPDENGATVDVALMVYNQTGAEPGSIHGAELAALVFGESQGQVRQTA